MRFGRFRTENFENFEKIEQIQNVSRFFNFNLIPHCFSKISIRERNFCMAGAGPKYKILASYAQSEGVRSKNSALPGAARCALASPKP